MKILFVACYSPLINNSAAIETLWYLNKLANYKNDEIHLLTVNYPQDSIYYDNGIFSLLDKKIKVHAIDGGVLFNIVVPKKKNNNDDDMIKQRKSSRRISILRKIKNTAAVPDAYVIWAFKASHYVKTKMKNEKFDLIFSMHEPPSSHICALMLKKYFGSIKFITYWSDPWLKDSTRENLGKLRKKIEGYIEEKVVRNSDKLIFVTEANRQDYISSYSLKESNTYIITRGYDNSTYTNLLEEKKPELINADKINIVYTGEIFSKLRDINPFIKALDIIRKENQELYNKFNILFFGNIDDQDALEKLKEHKCVNVSPRISYKEATKYILNGDLLLIFGNKNSRQIPAKIYDYFGAKGLIFIIQGDNNDPIQAVAKNSKCVLSKNDVKDIYYNLISAVDKIQTKKSDYCNPLIEYEWGNIVKKLYDIFEK